MKTNLIKTGYLFLSVWLLGSCTNNDQPNPTVACPSIDVLGLAFTGNINNASAMPFFGYFDNSTAVSNWVPIANISITNPATPAFIQLSSANNAVYNAATGDYKLVIAEEKRLITINAAGAISFTPITTGIAGVNITNAPVYSGGNLYFGNMTYTGVNMVFSVLDSSYALVNSITIPSGNISGNYSWNFTSATDGGSLIYFAIGNNIITYNRSTNTIVASVIPGVSSGTIIGLEFKGTNKLYALHEDWSAASTDLVEIDVTNPLTVTKASVISLGFQVNYEFFSTTYNECNQKFYLSTPDTSGSNLPARNIRIDLAGTPTIVPLTPVNVWITGLALKR
ncbi:hypothetical protein [Flavobacterium sp. FlaQc-50]|uniref:hypothetical protein n=1 Tax=unclassified Flavobacterium TaxID=196869 RepID=UPI0037575BAF